ncbi:hypothetical protein LUU34_00676000 [Aix galericulata]|nr:hypothetical protein LUU34_00676000 [Aix galericulata]
MKKKLFPFHNLKRHYLMFRRLQIMKEKKQSQFFRVQQVGSPRKRRRKRRSRVKKLTLLHRTLKNWIGKLERNFKRIPQKLNHSRK